MAEVTSTSTPRPNGAPGPSVAPRRGRPPGSRNRIAPARSPLADTLPDERIEQLAATAGWYITRYFEQDSRLTTDLLEKAQRALTEALEG